MKLGIVFHDFFSNALQRPLRRSPVQRSVANLKSLLDAAAVAYSQGLIEQIFLVSRLGHESGGIQPKVDEEVTKSVTDLLKGVDLPVQMMKASGAERAFNLWPMVRELPLDLVYIAEADLLHRGDSVVRLLSGYNWAQETLAPELIITPYQDPGIPADAQLLQANSCPAQLWRAVPQAGRSLLLGKHLIERFCEVFEYDGLRGAAGRQEGSNDLGAIFRLIPCIAPVPAIASPEVEASSKARLPS